MEQKLAKVRKDDNMVGSKKNVLYLHLFALFLSCISQTVVFLCLVFIPRDQIEYDILTKK